VAVCAGRPVAGDRLEELERELAEAKLALARRADFIACLTHEIRTPLTGVIGVAQMLMGGLAGQLSEEQRRFVDKICASGEHLLELVNRTLDLSAMSAGKLEVELEVVDQVPLAGQAVAVAAAMALERRQSMELFVSGGYRPWAKGDPLALRQVLMNLLGNACKYAHEGSRIVVSVCPDRTGFARVSVADDGPGIPPDKLERIFVPFERAGDGRDVRAGSGLGLPICRKIVELHGGDMWVCSEKGWGTLFGFTVRLTPPPLRQGLENAGA